MPNYHLFLQRSEQSSKPWPSVQQAVVSLELYFSKFQDHNLLLPGLLQGLFPSCPRPTLTVAEDLLLPPLLLTSTSLSRKVDLAPRLPQRLSVVKGVMKSET